MSTRVTFSDRYRTGLTAGTYRFVLGQTVTVGTENEHYYQDQRFEVVAPRFALDAGELQTTFPPPGGIGDYQRVLPHVVLRTRTLPWERKPWAGPDPAPPWLALIVLSERETAAATSRAGTVGELRPDRPGGPTRTEAGRTLLVPALEPPADDATPVRLLDLDAATFRAVRPGPADVPLLAHVRSVATIDKATAGLPVQEGTAPAGDYAVVVANRFPPPGACTVHLISLDGGEHLLGGALDGVSRVRLVSLHSWTFANAEGIDTFGELASQLVVGGFGVADEHGLAEPTDPADDPDEAAVERALAAGYVPLEYRPLDSSATFSWYRGPFAPRPRAGAGTETFTNADAALILDERTGVFDVSYAAAWELGRLLALGSPAFAGGLRTFVDAEHDAADLAESVKTFLELHHSALRSGAPGAGTATPTPVGLARDLATWLARLVLLYPVPLSYLVPHTALLPPESLRFFHLDGTWVDALVDGALAVGVRTTSDQAVVARTGVRTATDDLVRRYRSELLGTTPPPERAGEPITGLLLRSRLIPGWPGLEVRVAAGDGELEPDRLLRMDRLADDILLVLVRGVVTRVALREPAEGVRFGVDTEGRVGDDPRVPVLPGLVHDGVLRVAELRDRLRVGGSAGLARHMARQPEEQPFTWG